MSDEKKAALAHAKAKAAARAAAIAKGQAREDGKIPPAAQVTNVTPTVILGMHPLTLVVIVAVVYFGWKTLKG